MTVVATPLFDMGDNYLEKGLQSNGCIGLFIAGWIIYLLIYFKQACHYTRKSRPTINYEEID